MQLEHVKEKEIDSTENDDVIHEPQLDGNYNYFVPTSSPVLRPPARLQSKRAHICT
jgi:hypothetical protein